MSRRASLFALSLVALAGCRGGDAATDAPTSSIASASPSPSAAPVDLGVIERTRDTSAALSALAKARTTSERRLAARALTRSADAASAPRVAELLSDEDPEIVSLAAFALGQICVEKSAEYVPSLLARATSLGAELAGAPAREAELAPARRSLALALGRCGSDAAESALRSWLSGAPALAVDAAFGLGQLAASQGKLSDRSAVALLDGAKKLDSEAPLFAFTRLGSLSPAVQTRLLDVTGELLTLSPSARRSFAVRALGAAGFAAAAPLGRVLSSDKFSVEERAAAAFGLGRLGRTGQEELGAALASFLASARPWAERSADLVALSATLSTLNDAESARAELTQLARLDVPKDAPAWLTRRLVRARCRAAALLAPGTNALPRELFDCDPEKGGSVGQLALLSVLDRSKVQGDRLARYERIAESEVPAVREAALRLLSGHPEIPNAAGRLTAALESKAPGVVTTAAQILTSYPARAEGSGKDAGVDPKLSQALQKVFEREDLARSIETLASAADAVGALALLSYKGAVEKLCRGPHSELRRHAARSLAMLGDPKQKCDARALLPDVMSANPAARELVLELENGELSLRLDESAAPAAARRVSELARAGYYDGVAVHRVVEGFVVQFGDPQGDGFGDGKYAALPDERGPAEFAPLDVGMAAFGRDTATTQFFVALARYPQLDGAYTRLGQASGPWAELAPGDIVKKVRVVER